MTQATIQIPHMDIGAQTRALKSELLEGFGRVLDNTSFCLGKEVIAFEESFAAYCGVPHALGINSGTSALHLALLALGVGPGDEVITSSPGPTPSASSARCSAEVPELMPSACGTPQ